MSQRRAKQARRLQRLDSAGHPDNTERTRLPRFDPVLPASWDPAQEQAHRAATRRSMRNRLKDFLASGGKLPSK